MSDYDAVLAALDALTIVGAVCGVGSSNADLHIRVATAAVEYARATVALSEAWDGLARVEGMEAPDRDPEARAYDRACDAQGAAWLALRDAVVATLGPDE